MAKRKSKKKGTKKQLNPWQKWKAVQEQRKPILIFGFGLAAVMILYFALSYTLFFDNYINHPILKGYAHAGNAILDLIGLATQVDGTYIKGVSFSMNIGRGCDAVSPTILFIGAVLVYPTAFSNKWKVLLIAPFAFALLNLIRILSLFLLGVYAPSLFDFAHIEFWQGVFILITMMAWFYWLLQVLKKTKKYGLA